MAAINGDYYQDIADETVKQGNRSIYMTRRWFVTRPGIPPLVPVTRKEYLEAVLEYYEREKTGTHKKLSEARKEYDTRMAGLKTHMVCVFRRR
ncbi:MAG: hypothetical protein LRY55_07470 [Leadbetterella sp.]|nr:hypothetical protein [Leadbetterella sp.]